MAILKRAKSSIKGLVVDLTDLGGRIDTEVLARETADGVLANLETTAKESLVVAINEVHTAVEAVSGLADTALQVASNLSDVADVATARTNLEVLSSAEVASAISAAQLSLGTNFTVADIAARDLLGGLDTSDRVMVLDDGDSKWAMYTPGSVVPETGVGADWVKLNDQDALENSISGPALKIAYESNDDTNAFTDVAAAKVARISVTADVDLDDAVLKAGLAQEVGVGAVDAAPSTAAIIAYVEPLLSSAGATPILENVVVAGDLITLTHAPKGGVNGVMNFGTVRFVDEQTQAFDAPLVATANPKEFTVSVDVTSEWNGKTVQVQYLYTGE